MGGANEGEGSTFLLVSAECVVVLRGGVLVQLWREPPTEDGVRLVRRAVQEASDPLQLVVVVVEDPAATPKPESRAELTELNKALARPTAVVYENSGFGAAAVRGVAMAISAASGGAAAAIKMVPSIDQAVRWLEQYQKAPGLEGLETLVAEMRHRGAAVAKK